MWVIPFPMSLGHVVAATNQERLNPSITHPLLSNPGKLQ